MNRFALSSCSLVVLALLAGCASKSDAPAATPAAEADAGPTTPGSDAGTPTTPGTTPGAVTLAIVPCADSAADPKCKIPTKENAGTIGSGPAFSTYGLTDDIRGGFVTGTKLVTAVELGSDEDLYGVIMETDLMTGNRRVVSGLRSAADTVVGTGKMETNRGTTFDITNLNDVRDVKPLANGHYIALLNGQRTILIDIDPVTGNRTPVWASKSADDPTQRDVDEKDWAGVPAFCPAEQGGNYLQPKAYELAQGPDGALYLAVLLAGAKGVVKVKLGAQPLDTRCEVVTMVNSSGLDRGTGYAITDFGDLLFGNSKIYAVYSVGQVLLGFDPVTGERDALSSSSLGMKGTGTVSIGQRGQAVSLDGTALWQTGSTQQLVDDGFNVLKVDLATGNRTAIASNITDVVSDNAKLQVLGSTNGNLHDSTQGIWTVPGSTLLVVNMADAIHVLDPATATTNLLSH